MRVPSHFLPRVQSIAAEAAHQLPVAVQLGQDLRADTRLAMQVIGVLRDEKLKLTEPLELKKG